MARSNSIRVLQLGNSTGLYGAERWILALVRHLPKMAVESFVAVIKDDPEQNALLCERASLLGLKTHVFEAHGKLSRSAIGQLRLFVKENKIDIVHTHGYKTDIVGLVAVRGTGCKILSTPHGWTANAGFKLRLYELIDRFVFRFLDAIVPLSQELYENIRNIPGVRGKVVLIENAVDIDEIEDEALISREILAWKNRGHSIIGYIGRLTKGKGISVLLKAFARLKLNSTRLAIVGDGEQLHELEQRVATLGIGDSVCFFGFRDDRIAFLRGFDVFVLPSRSEGTPRCLMEAMAVGVPVVATDIPGCRDLVEDNVTGLLFPVDDDESLADRLSVMLADSQLRDSVARGARALIRSRYSAEVMASRYAELYAGLVCNHAR